MSVRTKLIIFVIFIMTAVSAVVAGITIRLLYGAAFTEESARLVAIVKSQARLIEAIARHEEEDSPQDHPVGARAATLHQLEEAHKQYKGFGETGEFTLAHRDGDQIVWELSHRHSDLRPPEPVKFDSQLAEPMRRALNRQAGTMVGLDYRGQTVLAAYEPVAVLNLGIVAKIDLVEVRAPFIRAGVLALFGALTVITIGTGLSIRITNPILRRLERSEAQHRAILASAVDPIITTNSFGIIQSVSESIKRILGYEPSELIGKNISLLIPDEEQTEHDLGMEKFRLAGQSTMLGISRELEAMAKDGTRLSIELSVSKVDIPGNPLSLFTGVIHDLTDSKLAEESLQRIISERTSQLEASHEQLRVADRLASIGTLAAGLGHDMNNVLFPMRCRLDTLMEKPTDKDAMHHVQAIRSAVDYLQKLTDGLHLLALDPDELVTSSESVQLSQWWKQAGPLLSKALPKHVKLTTHLPDDLPAVAMPPHRLTQAVLNLIVNSGEAIDQDGHVQISATYGGKDNIIEIAVKDNGYGMSAEVKNRALDPFFTTKKRGLGTGLGLSLVQGVVREAGGSLHIQSAPDEGTTVTLLLPTIPSSLFDETKDRPAARVTVSDKRIASLVRTCLEAAGMKVSQDDELSQSGSYNVWVTDPSLGSIEEAQELMRLSNTQILVLGDAPSQWTDLGAAIITDPQDFEQVRRCIDEAAFKLNGGQS